MSSLNKKRRDFISLFTVQGILPTIDSLKEFVLDTSEKYNRLILIEAHFNEVVRRKHANSISYENLSLEEGKTRETLLDFINGIEMQDTVLDSDQTDSKFSPIVEEVSFNLSNKRQDRIFLCHASEDKKQILEFYHKLKAAGFNPWLDKMDLLPGQKWDREIKRMLKGSRFIIIFFSQHSISKRGYVQREFKLALDTLEEIPEDQIFIIPVRLEECKIPETFNHIQYVDLFEQNGFHLVRKVIELELELENSNKLEFPQELTNKKEGIFTDTRDGQIYRTIELQGKIWLAENLNFDTGEGCHFYDYDPQFGEKKYGLLYTWEAAQKACPPGWHIPTIYEWEHLVHSFGKPESNGNPLIRGGSTGFDVLFGGYFLEEVKWENKVIGAIFHEIDNGASFWCNEVVGEDKMYYYWFNKSGYWIGKFIGDMTGGLSCRCIRDQ